MMSWNESAPVCPYPDPQRLQNCLVGQKRLYEYDRVKDLDMGGFVLVYSEHWIGTDPITKVFANEETGVRVGKGAGMKEAEAGVMGPQAEQSCQSETREHRWKVGTSPADNCIPAYWAP